MDPITIAALSFGLKGLGSLFGGRSRRRQETENRRATTAGLNLNQRQSEDRRRARLAYGQGLLGRVPSTVGTDASAGSLALSPELYGRLDQERTYDFGSALPRSRGGTDAFLSGLFNSGADVAPYLMGTPGGDGTGLDATTVPPDSGVDPEYLRSLTRTGGSR